MARQKSKPVLADNKSSTEVFVPTPLSTITVISLPVQDTILDMVGYWMTSAGYSSIPEYAIPHPYLISGTVVESPANYAWWIYKAVGDTESQYAVIIENSYEFEISEYNAEGEIEEMWYFT